MTLTTEEIERLRADTAGLSSLPDGRIPIFFNNAGASLQPRSVVQRVIDHLRLEEQIGGYEAADLVADERIGVYRSVARLLNAQPDEIAITESATRAWDMVFYAFRFRPGDRVVTAQNEYSSNSVALLQAAQRHGVEIVIAESDPSGAIDLEKLRNLLQAGGVRLVAFTHIATNNGMVQPAGDVGRLTREFDVPYLLDACQSAGQMHLDVEALGCDFLSATGRKFLRGPRGTGFLYVRRSWIEQLEPPFLDTHAAEWTATDTYTIRKDARRFEAWESSLATTLGLGAAAEYAMRIGLPRIEARTQYLARCLRTRLAAVPGIHVTDAGAKRSGIVCFFHEAVPAQQLKSRLVEQGIVVRVSDQQSTRFDPRLSSLADLVRASIHYYNTEDEIERFCLQVAAFTQQPSA